LKEGVVGKLIGVDIADPAIRDAKVNAAKNGFSTNEKTDASNSDAITRFIASPAEKVLAEEMKSVLKTTPIVAVVDPARDGLHGTVVQTLRRNERIERLVYVSCNPTGTLVRDAGMLCGPPTKVRTVERCVLNLCTSCF
jgi:tRNA (uracil-5-)-methyltransferase